MLHYIFNRERSTAPAHSSRCCQTNMDKSDVAKSESDEKNITTMSLSVLVDQSGRMTVSIPNTTNVSFLKSSTAKSKPILTVPQVVPSSGLSSKVSHLLSEQENEDEVNKKYLFTCQVGDCDNNFITKEDVEQHQLKKHSIDKYSPENVKVETTAGDALPISDSDRRAMRRKSLANAVKIACDICGQMIRKDWTVRHLRNVHDVEMVDDERRAGVVRTFPKVGMIQKSAKA